MVHRSVSTCDYFLSTSLATRSLGGAVLWAFSMGHCAVDSSGGQSARFTTKSSTCGRSEEARTRCLRVETGARHSKTERSVAYALLHGHYVLSSLPFRRRRHFYSAAFERTGKTWPSRRGDSL